MDTKTDLNRRRFLLAAGAGGAGALVTVTRNAREAPQAQPDDKARPGGSTSGYSETGHVRNYYRTTRI